MKPKNKIIRLKTKYPLMPNAEIGEQVGVSRGYVYKVLRNNNLNTIVPKKRKVKYCEICGKVMDIRKVRPVCSNPCRFLYYRIRVTCSYCTIDFYLKRGEVVQRYKRGYNNIYCSRSCYNKGQRKVL